MDSPEGIRVIGGPNPPCPYETSAAGPIWAPGGVHERLRQERRHPAAVCAAERGALCGPGARREGVPAAGWRQRGGGVCGPPQAAHGRGASAASGAAEARSAARVGHLIQHCRLRTTALRGVLWRHRSCAADFSLLNLPKGKSLGRSKPATNS